MTSPSPNPDPPTEGRSPSPTGDRPLTSPRAPRARRLAIRALCYGSAAWILTGGDPTFWSVGVPTVLLAAGVGLHLAGPSPPRWRLGAQVPYALLFLHRSLRGGVDVARRALHPRRPLAPALLRYRLRLEPDGPAAVFFADLISLLPGTLCAGLEGDRVTVHVVDRALPNEAELRRLEERVADLFGEPSPQAAPPPDEGASCPS